MPEVFYLNNTKSFDYISFNKSEEIIINKISIQYFSIMEK